MIVPHNTLQNTLQRKDVTTMPKTPFILTNDNYYSDEANQRYMSVSQFKDFAGTTSHGSCEEAALMKTKGILPEQTTTAKLVGSFVDSYFEGTLDKFKENNKNDLYKKTGDKSLKAEYVDAENIIARIHADNLFSEYMSGQTQVIMTGNMLGTDWKIKMDQYFPDDKIVDLKVMGSMDPIWSDRLHRKVTFIHHWGYDIQGAIYQQIVYQNTGKFLPFYIACATKKTQTLPTNIEIIQVTQPHLDAAFNYVKKNMPRILAIKAGTEQPRRCNACAYCYSTKVLCNPITIDSIIPAYRYIDENEDSDDTEETENGYRIF